MQLLQEGTEVVGILAGAACYLAGPQWELPAPGEEAATGPDWRADFVGKVPVRWQANRPRMRGAEFAYPLLLAAMRAVVRRTRREPPFVVIADLSEPARTHIEVGRVGPEGITRLDPLSARSAGNLARAVERLTTDDTEPVFYLGTQPFPSVQQSRIGELVVPLASFPEAAQVLLAAGTNHRRAVPLVWLGRRGRSALLLALGLALWGGSAFQWWRIGQQFDRYGPQLADSELVPLKERLRQQRQRRAGLEQTFAQARSGHLSTRLLVELLRPGVTAGVRVRQLHLADERQVELVLAGEPRAVLRALERFESLGRLDDLTFGGQDRDQVSVPIRLDFNRRSRPGSPAA